MATTESIKEMMLSLFPPGSLFDRGEDSKFSDLIAGLADELARLDSRVDDLLRESDPYQANELLPDYETTAGLPDNCLGLGETIQQRRADIVAKFLAIGGQSKTYFLSLASLLGYQIRIIENHPFRIGIDGMGDMVADIEWQYSWYTQSQVNNFTWFRTGVSGMGEPLRSWSDASLECYFSMMKPAHTQVAFTYSGFDQGFNFNGFF